MYILGINISHELSACLLKDGEIVYFIESDRISGVKVLTDGAYGRPKMINGKPTTEFSHQISSIKKYTSEVDYVIFSSFGRDPIDVDEEIRRCIIDELTRNNIKFKTSVFYSENHHIYHACNAFYASGFDDAAALVMDGGGAYDNEYRESFTSKNVPIDFPFREVETIYDCSYDGIEQKYGHYSLLDDLEDGEEEFIFWKKSDTEIFSRTRSCGDSFAFLAGALGMTFDRGTPAGKVMGLSGHFLKSKNPQINFSVIKDYLKRYEVFTENWFVKYDNEWITRPGLEDSIRDLIEIKKIDISLDKPDINFYVCAALAQKLQKETFIHTCRLINRALITTKKKKIVLSGGYFMNCVNNYKYTEVFPDVEFFIDPIPHDAGTAIGAAKYFWYNFTRSKDKKPFENIYFGP